MQKFETVKSKVIPLRMNDVDTDQIIPAQFLTSVSKDGYGENLFRRLKNEDPNFPMNKPEYKGAEILVAGYNFGCGSSREHAVWAIAGAGIKVVIAESFADIFFNNSAKNGLLLVVLPKEAVEKLQNCSEEVSVDLESQTVKTGSGESFKFDYDPFRKYCLTGGLDDIDYILTCEEEIDQFRSEKSKSWMKLGSDKSKTSESKPVQPSVS